jgi:ubiquinone/menaquinone biosynthesis C-methylase UbiE
MRAALAVPQASRQRKDRTIYGLLYDATLWWAERRGMERRRARVVSEASGRVLEIGAGTGLNLPHYGGAVTELTRAEPEAGMLGRLEGRLRESGRDGSVVQAAAESLPFPDGSFDTVVSTLVLCTVDDPERALAEIARVLAPDGRLLFIEHVRADEGTRLAQWQQRLRTPWAAVAGGCDCTRDTVGYLERAGYELPELRREEWQAVAPLVRPLVVGQAVRAAPHRRSGFPTGEPPPG